MTEFTSKEEYQRWKDSRLARGREGNRAPQTTSSKTPAAKLFIVKKAQQAQKAALQVVFQKFRELKSGLSVGLNKLSYNDRLISIKIELDKFESAHKGIFEDQKGMHENRLATSLVLLAVAFQAYKDGEKARGEDCRITLTNRKGDYYPWAQHTLEKCPPLKEKTRKFEFSDGVEIYLDRSDYKDVVWAYADEYVRKAEAAIINV